MIKWILKVSFILHLGPGSKMHDLSISLVK